MNCIKLYLRCSYNFCYVNFPPSRNVLNRRLLIVSWSVIEWEPIDSWPLQFANGEHMSITNSFASPIILDTLNAMCGSTVTLPHYNHHRRLVIIILMTQHGGHWKPITNIESMRRNLLAATRSHENRCIVAKWTLTRITVHQRRGNVLVRPRGIIPRGGSVATGAAIQLGIAAESIGHTLGARWRFNYSPFSAIHRWVDESNIRQRCEVILFPISCCTIIYSSWPLNDTRSYWVESTTQRTSKGLVIALKSLAINPLSAL